MIGAAGLALLGWLAGGAHAQPTADQVLSDAGLTPDDKQRVLSGEYVAFDVSSVSERDLAVSMAFLVKTSPEALAKQILKRDLVTADSQVQAFGELKSPGNLADLAGLRITADEASALTGAKAGGPVNLSAEEIAAFSALRSAPPSAVQQQLQKMLLARYQGYRAAGLAGIAPYARSGGNSNDAAADLRKASQSARGLAKYLPSLQAVLLDYPKATAPGMEQSFTWLKYNIQGKPTYVLQQTIAVPDGAARAVVQRQYYASTGYNVEQAVAGFLPVQGGTLAVYTSHAFTDQVAGFGGSMKRGIGSRVMAAQLQKMFEAGRTKAVQ